MSAPPTVHFTTHAEERLDERQVDRKTLLAVLREPTMQGPADHGCRWVAGSVIAKSRHTWMTAIYAEADNGIVVLTTYMGPPSRKRTTDAIRQAPRPKE